MIVVFDQQVFIDCGLYYVFKIEICDGLFGVGVFVGWIKGDGEGGLLEFFFQLCGEQVDDVGMLFCVGGDKNGGFFGSVVFGQDFGFCLFQYCCFYGLLFVVKFIQLFGDFVSFYWIVECEQFVFECCIVDLFVGIDVWVDQEVEVIGCDGFGEVGDFEKCGQIGIFLMLCCNQVFYDIGLVQFFEWNYIVDCCECYEVEEGEKIDGICCRMFCFFQEVQCCYQNEEDDVGCVEMFLI